MFGWSARQRSATSHPPTRPARLMSVNTMSIDIPDFTQRDGLFTARGFNDNVARLSQEIRNIGPDEEIVLRDKNDESRRCLRGYRHEHDLCCRATKAPKV